MLSRRRDWLDLSVAPPSAPRSRRMDGQTLYAADRVGWKFGEEAIISSGPCAINMDRGEFIVGGELIVMLGAPDGNRLVPAHS